MSRTTIEAGSAGAFTFFPSLLHEIENYTKWGFTNPEWTVRMRKPNDNNQIRTHVFFLTLHMYFYSLTNAWAHGFASLKSRLRLVLQTYQYKLNRSAVDFLSSKCMLCSERSEWLKRRFDNTGRLEKFVLKNLCPWKRKRHNAKEWGLFFPGCSLQSSPVNIPWRGTTRIQRKWSGQP